MELLMVTISNLLELQNFLHYFETSMLASTGVTESRTSQVMTVMTRKMSAVPFYRSIFIYLDFSQIDISYFNKSLSFIQSRNSLIVSSNWMISIFSSCKNDFLRI